MPAIVLPGIHFRCFNCAPTHHFCKGSSTKGLLLCPAACLHVFRLPVSAAQQVFAALRG